MNRQNWMRTVMAGLLVLLGVSAAAAFGPGSVELRVNIPFNFMVGNHMLAAGAYRVSDPSQTLAFLQIRNQKAHHGSAIVRTISMEASTGNTESKLVFNRYGDHYFLSQVWTAGHTGGYTIPKSSHEREVAGELAGNNARGPDVVSLVASVR
jgi:hypothetical protein